MAVRIRDIGNLQNAIDSAITSESPEELGKLLIQTVSEMDSLYKELGINQSPGEDGYMDYEYSPADQQYRSQYEALRNEYRERFGGVHQPNDRNTESEIPYNQPAVDDILIEIDPHTGVEKTRKLEIFE